MPTRAGADVKPDDLSVLLDAPRDRYKAPEIWEVKIIARRRQVVVNYTVHEIHHRSLLERVGTHDGNLLIVAGLRESRAAIQTGRIFPSPSTIVSFLSLLLYDRSAHSNLFCYCRSFEYRCPIFSQGWLRIVGTTAHSKAESVIAFDEPNRIQALLNLKSLESNSPSDSLNSTFKPPCRLRVGNNKGAWGRSQLNYKRTEDQMMIVDACRHRHPLCRNRSTPFRSYRIYRPLTCGVCQRQYSTKVQNNRMIKINS